MDQKRKNIILIVAALLVTNLITHYASSSNQSILGKKTTVTVASVDGKEFSSNDIYNTWIEEGQSTTAINSLVTAIDKYILDDKYAKNKEIDEEVETQAKQTKAYYESQGQDFTQLLEQNNMDEETWKELLRTQICTQKETLAYVEGIVTKDQVEEAYNADPAKSKISHILFKVSPSDTEAVEDVEKAAKEKADEVYKELSAAMEKSDDKQATFAEFAKKYSEDEDSKDKGGDIGYSNSEDEAYQTAIKDIEVGEYTEVVKTSYGYAIIMKTDVQEKKSLDDKKVYKKYQTQVAEKMIEENANYAQIAMIELRSEYGIKFVDTKLGEQYSALVEQANTALETANETPTQ